MVNGIFSYNYHSEYVMHVQIIPSIHEKKDILSINGVLYTYNRVYLRKIDDKLNDYNSVSYYVESKKLKQCTK